MLSWGWPMITTEPCLRASAIAAWNRSATAAGDGSSSRKISRDRLASAVRCALAAATVRGLVRLSRRTDDDAAARPSTKSWLAAARSSRCPCDCSARARGARRPAQRQGGVPARRGVVADARRSGHRRAPSACAALPSCRRDGPVRPIPRRGAYRAGWLMRPAGSCSTRRSRAGFWPRSSMIRVRLGRAATRSASASSANPGCPASARSSARPAVQRGMLIGRG